MRKFTFLVPVLAVMAFAAVADAGPLARLRARFGGVPAQACGGCGSAGATFATAQPFAPVAVAAQPVVHQAVYNPGQGVPTSNAVYQPIRLTSPLPVCPTCPK